MIVCLELGCWKVMSRIRNWLAGELFSLPFSPNLPLFVSQGSLGQKRATKAKLSLFLQDWGLKPGPLKH